MFCNSYEDDEFISFDDPDVNINWKGLAKHKGNIPTGEIKGRLLLSHGSKEYLESISQLFNTKKMTLDAIVKLHPGNDYHRRSTNENKASFYAANANSDVGENPGERVYDKDVEDDDNENVSSKLVTIDQNKKLLPINQRSTVRKRQAPCRLSLEGSHSKDNEDLITSKKAKQSSKEKKDNMGIAHKAASDRILSLDKLDDSFDYASWENDLTSAEHTSPQAKDILADNCNSTLTKILVECTKNPLGKESCVTVGPTSNYSTRARCESNFCKEKDDIIEELKLEIKFQKDINKSMSMQTTVLTDVRQLLLNMNSKQLTPPSTSNGGNTSNSSSRPSTPGSSTAYPTLLLGNCAKTKRLEMPLADDTDSTPLTSTVLEDEDDGSKYDHKTFPIPDIVLRRILKGPVTQFVSHLMDKLYSDQYLATHKMTDMKGACLESKRIAMNKCELQHIIDRVLDCELVTLGGPPVNEKMIKSAISRKFNNSRAK